MSTRPDSDVLADLATGVYPEEWRHRDEEGPCLTCQGAKVVEELRYYGDGEVGVEVVDCEDCCGSESRAS